jgi:hypothetical protein
MGIRSYQVQQTHSKMKAKRGHRPHARRNFDSRQEATYLLRSPANARHITEAAARHKSGQSAVVKAMKQLKALVAEREKA